MFLEEHVTRCYSRSFGIRMDGEDVVEVTQRCDWSGAGELHGRRRGSDYAE